MTEETAYEGFIGALEKRKIIGDLLNQRDKDPIPEKKDEAQQRLNALAYAELPENARPAHPEDLSDEVFKRGINVAIGRREDEAGSILAKSLELLVSQIPEKTLDRLTAVKEINSIIEDRDLVKRYLAYLGIKEIMARYETGQNMSGEETKLIVGAAADGLAEAEVKKMEEQQKIDKITYSGSVKDSIRNLARAAVLSGYANEETIKEYALPGLTIQLDKAKKSYDDVAASKGHDIYRAVRKAIKTAVVDGSTEDRVKVRDIIYAAEKGKLKRAEE